VDARSACFLEPESVRNTTGALAHCAQVIECYDADLVILLRFHGAVSFNGNVPEWQRVPRLTCEAPVTSAAPWPIRQCQAQQQAGNSGVKYGQCE